MRGMTIMIGAGLVASVAFGCGGSPSAPSGSGTLNLRITDSPFTEAKAVLVTFSEVTAHRSSDAEGEGNSGSSTLPFAGAAASRRCDLKKLEQGADDVLGVGALPAGHYTMLRLVVSTATLYFDNPSAGPACSATLTEPAGARASLTIPSGEVKLNRQFTVPEGGATTILLDFDGDRSIHQTGSGEYRMSPVIGIVSVN